MKKVLTIAAVTLLMAGSTAFACDTCGCKDKKAEKKACCTAEKKCADCTTEKPCATCVAKAKAKAEAEAAAAE